VGFDHGFGLELVSFIRLDGVSEISRNPETIPYPMRSIVRKSVPVLISSLLVPFTVLAQDTTVTVSIPEAPARIDPMIYGQMLENVNDQMIYGGVAEKNGVVRKHVIPHLQELKIPVMRWPGGTVVYEYQWRNGIGPKNKRPTVPNLAWGGVENYQFGTDEFLQWCKEVGTVPYINLNMSLRPEHQGTLEEALAWIAYVNDEETTELGKLRAQNGHRDPYGVKFWCIGNENYLNNRHGRVQETDEQYSKRLNEWAGAIRKSHPDLQLLGIGHTKKWNETVLAENGQLIDFLTQHYYVKSKVEDGKIQDPLRTLFAPAEMEAHLVVVGAQLREANRKLGREDRPIRLSVDEWNNRHAIIGEKGFKLSRQSPRRAFDVPVIGGMLNAFIRQSPEVGMANYIFPVNAHGLVRTVGEDDAYRTAIYPVFKKYREQMVGRKLDVVTKGASLDMTNIKPTIDGDTNYDKISMEGVSLPFVDSAAVLGDDGHVHVSLVNRSPDAPQAVTVSLPNGYKCESVWKLSHQNINAMNDSGDRDVVKPSVDLVKEGSSKLVVEVPPCGVFIVKFARAGQ
jgi:alpha-N-arabinofuranosidase